MNNSMGLSGEVFDHKVAAVFETGSDAEIAARTICETTSLDDDQVTLLRPNAYDPDWELEPEDQGIWRTLVQSHLWLGAMGIVAGLILFLVLSAMNIGFIVLNTWVAASVLAALGGICGLLAAGAVTIRPDHMPYLMTAQSALRNGYFVLAVHTSSLQQLEEVQKVLRKWHTRLIRTF